jgi:hypothetical protein
LDFPPLITATMTAKLLNIGLIRGTRICYIQAFAAVHIDDLIIPECITGALPQLIAATVTRILLHIRLISRAAVNDV